GHVQLHVAACGRFQHHIAVQGIATEDGDFNSQRSSQLHDLSRICNGNRAENHICVLIYGLIKICGEVGCIGREGILFHGAVKCLLKIINQALVVLVAQLTQAVSFFRREFLLCE
ncbi:hypothetical protein AKKGGB_AKKGGB_16425, partial [Dysosmobacter welbionis]